MTPLQKFPKNVGELGKLIVAKGFEKLPKVQKIAQSGHTGLFLHLIFSNSALPSLLQRLSKRQKAAFPNQKMFQAFDVTFYVSASLV